ncbi:MAG: hypothetical protein Q9164_004194 [Protoblastenia rupestris]
MSSDTQKIFINLPVTNLQASMAFYAAIGFTANPKFSDDNATMMVLSPSIHVMLLTHTCFGGFLPSERKISDARKVTEVILCLSAESKEKVDEMVEKAAAAGGKRDVGFTQTQEASFMYGRSFDDLDGHVWEVTWMMEGGDEECFEEGKTGNV